MGGHHSSKRTTLQEVAQNMKPDSSKHKDFIINKKQMKYVDTIAYIVYDSKSSQSGPSKILDHLYLGNITDAKDIVKLKELGITHICSTVEAEGNNLRNRYASEFEYYGFSADDHPQYPILNHFEDVFNFIESARENNGKCFIHCMAGVNRSGCLTTAYVMVYENIGPIQAAEKVFNSRGMLLTNSGFIKQFILFADERKLLKLDQDKINHDIPSRIMVPSRYKNDWV